MFLRAVEEEEIRNTANKSKNKLKILFDVGLTWLWLKQVIDRRVSPLTYICKTGSFPNQMKTAKSFHFTKVEIKIISPISSLKYWIKSWLKGWMVLLKITNYQYGLKKTFVGINKEQLRVRTLTTYLFSLAFN